MPIVNRLPINSNDDDEHYKVLIHRPTKIMRSYASFSLGSTIVVQQDGEPWTHGTVIGRCDHNHSNRPDIIKIIKTGHVVTGNS